jgi:hypothetical protein
MKPQNILSLILFGFVFWLLGTLFYRVRGPMVFETTSLRYWINFALTSTVSTAVCILLLKILRLPAQQWPAAALLIALPGMFGEALILSSFTTFMPRMNIGSGGKYGALLFASYALFLTICEFIGLSAPSAAP